MATVARRQRTRIGRRGIAAIAAAAAVAVVAASAPSAGAAKEAPAQLDAIGLAGPLGSDPAVEALRRDRTKPDASGAFIYRKGRYTPLDAVPNQPIRATSG